MSRGFNITVGVTAAEDLTDEKLAAEIAASGQLTVKESEGLLPACVSAAKSLLSAVGLFPARVFFAGADRSAEKGENTIVTVTIVSTENVVTEEAPVGTAPTVFESTLADPVPEDAVPSTEVLPEGSAPSPE